ncbi:MAG TPA: helix-turn-helix transcriptional regulator, partial [Cryptosporangiaceae bacterium]|nr:helix-turn-helix transcriptional regulator [Cryptosporangiaceae bacterium]
MSDPDKTTLVAEVLASPRGRAAVLAGRPGSLVRLVRSSLGWTQAELGERIGYSQATVSRLESGRGRIVDVVVLAKLADVLAIPPAALGVAGPPGSRRRGDGRSTDPAIRDAGLTLDGRGSREASVKRSEFMRSLMGA